MLTQVIHCGKTMCGDPMCSDCFPGDDIILTGLGATSKATTTNPKDILGIKKVPLSQVPAVAQAHESCAMLDGDLKYGFRNWRAKNVKAHIYIDAAFRHIQAWAEGEEYAPDSGVHHLGHARACLGILLDAQANGNLIDDRSKGVYSQVAEQLSAWVSQRVERANAARTNHSAA